jgi:hypothetical protein
MRTSVLLLLLLSLNTIVNAQLEETDLTKTSSRLLIEGRHIGGSGRTYLTLRNLSNGRGACVDMRIYSGGTSFTSIGHHSTSYGSGYTYLPLYAGFGQIWSTGEGLILRASPVTKEDPEGIIRFETGWRDEGSSNERMRISAAGYIGIDCTSPHARLQLGSGDIYLQNPESGIIMTSPNGQCWKLTVTNKGKAKYSKVDCLATE